MKKITLALAALLTLSPILKADEGMWLLPLIEKMNADAIRNLGSRLTPEQIYSINNSSIKDAIVHFGGGCTAEIISGSGLLVTNHHCGYSSIQGLSSPEHNYLEDGYFAMSKEEELPVPGLTVTFLQSMTDVTAEVAAGKRDEVLAKGRADNPGCQVQITSFFNDNAFYMIVSKVYRDIRFVGAPPAASGKFGGDTDNWMWPRHTCDFSMFRVYAGKDNEPAEYSEDNVTMVPRQFLNVSLKGVKEGDFAMIMGYPGRTQRFQTAAQLEDMLAVNEIRINARTVRQDVIWEARMADPVINLQYASKYASSSNGWKKWQGMRESFEKLHIIEKELAKEAEFTNWVKADPARNQAYGNAISDIADVTAKTSPALQAFQLLNESLSTIELVSFAGNAGSSLNLLAGVSPKDPDYKAKEKAVLDVVKEIILPKFKDYNAQVDHDVAVAMFNFYRQNVNPADAIKLKGKDILTMDVNKYVDNLFKTSLFTSEEKINSKNFTAKAILADPAVQLYNAIVPKLKELQTAAMEGQDVLRDASKAFTAGLLEWKPDEASYPDANSTCRLTFGTVKSYEPKDGVLYKYYTTLDGVMEKEDPDNYEFRVPAKLKEIYNSKDYGQYANEEGKVVACFLTNLDITGGNSGSPVMDADGNLIGLAFDGNWEAMSGDVLFDPDLQRCICVDIRYVLLMVDKYAGAGYLLNEMNLVK